MKTSLMEVFILVSTLENPIHFRLSVLNNLKMGRYSYSQPSEDEPLFGNNDDSGYSETEDLIRRDQAELSLERSSQVHYPPQPEVEFGFPQVCYCGAHPVLATSNSRNDQGMYYGSCLST